MGTAESIMYLLTVVDLKKAITINSFMRGFSLFCCLVRYVYSNLNAASHILIL